MNSFLQTIQNIEGGHLSEDLGEKLAGLIGKIKERGKAGTLTLSLKIKPEDSDGEVVAVTASVKVTEPAKSERVTIFFTTEDDTLVRDNPAQQTLKLEAVDKPVTLPQPVAKVAATA